MGKLLLEFIRQFPTFVFIEYLPYYFQLEFLEKVVEVIYCVIAGWIFVNMFLDRSSIQKTRIRW